MKTPSPKCPSLPRPRFQGPFICCHRWPHCHCPEREDLSFTVNDAFAALDGVSPSVVANLQTDEWSNHLQDALLYHVLDSKVPSSAVTHGLKAATLKGEDLSFTVKKHDTFVNTNSEVILTDILADNGVIHVIDNVLLPSWLGKSIFDIIGRSDDLSKILKFIDIVQNVIEDVLSTAGAYTLLKAEPILYHEWGSVFVKWKHQINSYLFVTVHYNDNRKNRSSVTLYDSIFEQNPTTPSSSSSLVMTFSYERVGVGEIKMH